MHAAFFGRTGDDGGLDLATPEVAVVDVVLLEVFVIVLTGKDAIQEGLDFHRESVLTTMAAADFLLRDLAHGPPRLLFVEGHDREAKEKLVWQDWGRSSPSTSRVTIGQFVLLFTISEESKTGWIIGARHGRQLPRSDDLPPDPEALPPELPHPLRRMAAELSGQAACHLRGSVESRDGAIALHTDHLERLSD